MESVKKVWGQRELVQMASVLREWVPKVWGQRELGIRAGVSLGVRARVGSGVSAGVSWSWHGVGTGVGWVIGTHVS